MYRNANELQPGEILREFDICIVGAGAAGIAVAKKLLNSSKRVLLLASGICTDVGAPSGGRERLYEGTLGTFMRETDRAFLTRSRQRMYGGTTNHFGFWAAPLTEADLLFRPGYRAANWPLGMDELDTYYPEANTFGDYGPFNYNDIGFWADVLRGEPFPPRSDDQLQNAIFHAQYDCRIHDFQLHYGAELKSSSNVTVLFNSNVLEVLTEDNRSHVLGLNCATIEAGARGRNFSVELGPNGTYVLAQGGIEPVRLLFLSGNLGDNPQGMLGKGFMVHPVIENAAYLSFSPAVSKLVRNFFEQQRIQLTPEDERGAVPAPIVSPVYHPADLENTHDFTAWGVLAPTKDAMDDEMIGNFRAILNFAKDGTGAGINMNWEQVPNENSVITLDQSKTDPFFHQPVVHLDWNLLEADKRTYDRGLDLCKQYLEARGGSDFRIITPLNGDPGNWTVINPGDHHMGALRMSQNASDGIVDPNCRIHTVDNLYIAGCGVYPTSGYANPTLTIVALALRLADHLKGLD